MKIILETMTRQMHSRSNFLSKMGGLVELGVELGRNSLQQRSGNLTWIQVL